MKRLITMLTGLFCAVAAGAQTPSWTWAKAVDNSNNTIATAVAVDNSGNIYTVGNYKGLLAFDTVNYVAQGMQNAYILKYSATGKLLWSRAISGTGTISANTITVDTHGDLYIAGYFTDIAHFGDSTVSSQGGKDVFIAKYTKDGIVSWLHAHGSVFDDAIENGMAIDHNNNLVISGYFCDNEHPPLVAAQIIFGNSILASNGKSDIFIAKYDTGGHVIWAKNSRYQVSEHAHSIAVDKSDNIYVIGDFDAQMSFDTLLLSSISNNFFDKNVFLTKYDSAGKPLWVKLVGGAGVSSGGGGYGGSGGTSGSVSGTSLTLDTADNAIIGGSFSGCKVIFDKQDNTFVQSVGNIWFAKLSPSGNMIWSSSSKGSGRGNDQLNGIVCDRDGSLYLTGQYGDVSIFVSKYLNNGQLSWLQTASGNGEAYACGIALSNPGELIVAGQFLGSVIRFGNAICINNSTAGNGFVAKLGPGITGVLPPESGIFNIYPNPATTSLNLSINNPGRFSKCVVTDVLGRQVVSGQINAKHEQAIILPDLPNGIYYLTLFGNNESVAQPLSIQH